MPILAILALALRCAVALRAPGRAPIALRVPGRAPIALRVPRPVLALRVPAGAAADGPPTYPAGLVTGMLAPPTYGANVYGG